MAHGFSGVKEQIDHYAAHFARAGFTVFVHDHRGFGASDEVPRLEVDPGLQLKDWRDAISFALSRPETDPDAGVGVWGSSFAGGLAMMLAATDSRARCVVSQIPHVSGYRNGRWMFNAAERERLKNRLAADRAARFAGAAPEMVPVFSSDPSQLSALPPAKSARSIRAAEDATPAWRNEVTLRSMGAMLSVEPGAWAPHISPKPFLIIVGAKDTCTFPEHQLEAFAQAREPKRLLIHPGGHFETYTEHFKRTAGAALEWFEEHLRPAAAAPAAGTRKAPASRAGATPA